MSNTNTILNWRAVSVIATIASLGILAGCAAEEDEVVVAEEAEMSHDGEGAATDGADPATDDVAYLTQLGLIRGHLHVGYMLYDTDLPGLAETHMKHPREEIYADLVPAFEARGCAGFADNLSALTEAVVGRADKADVSTIQQGLLAAIDACESSAATDNAATAASVIENLLRTACDEYAIGIVDGKVNNLHEYQDAWGFTQVAKVYAESAAFAGNAAVGEEIQAVLASVDSLWPSLNPEGGVDGDAAKLLEAANAIQALAAGL
ncbi:MAG: hypothetical protein AAF351_06760 [Pseudomonadota bacterium]